jgi:hypothetical protein
VRPVQFEKERNCREVRKVGNDDDYNGHCYYYYYYYEIKFLFNNVLSQQPSGHYQKQHNKQTRITKGNKKTDMKHQQNNIII